MSRRRNWKTRFRGAQGVDPDRVSQWFVVIAYADGTRWVPCVSEGEARILEHDHTIEERDAFAVLLRGRVRQ